MALAVWLGSCAVAQAQGYFDESSSILPATGISVRPGDLRRHFQPAQDLKPDDHAPGWQISTGIDIQEEYTDNVFAGGYYGGGGGGKPIGDFITTISPTISVSGDTSRIKANLFYSPSVQLYAHETSQNAIANNFTGSVDVTLVPDALFLSLRGLASVQNIGGGYGTQGTGTQAQQNQVQTTTFSASPYFLHQFGGTGTLNVGVSIAHTSQTGLGGLGNGQYTSTAAGGGLTSQQQLQQQQQITAASLAYGNYTTTQEYASFATGEDFGRVSQRVSASATQYDGIGVYQGAFSNVAAYDLGYAVNRTVTIIGRVGYQDLAYGGVPAFRYSGLLWNVGTKITVNQDTTLTITYGRNDGVTAFAFDGAYAVSPRVRLFARYSEGIETGQEDTQAALGSANIDQGGGLFDAQNGTPLALGNNFFGLQNNLFRLKRFSASAVYLLDRDSYTASLVYQKETVLAFAAANPALSLAYGAPGSSEGTYLTLNWTHDLSADLNLGLGAQAGRFVSISAPRYSQLYGSLSASANYALSQTLSLRGQYSFTRTTSNLPGGSFNNNIVLVGLHKQF